MVPEVLAKPHSNVVVVLMACRSQRSSAVLVSYKNVDGCHYSVMYLNAEVVTSGRYLAGARSLLDCCRDS